MNIPHYNTNTNTKSDKTKCENELSSINNIIMILEDILNRKIKPAKEQETFISDKSISNIRRRVEYKIDNEDVSEFIIQYIDNQDNLRDKSTKKAKKNITSSYISFFENLLNELKTYKKNLKEKKERFEQIEYEKERCENQDKEFKKEDIELPKYEYNLDEKLNEIEQDTHKDKENSGEKTKMMSVEEFILIIIIQLKKINDLNYNIQDYQIYQNRYPQKIQVIERNIKEDNLMYLCKDVNNLPPLTQSQIETLNIIKQMIDQNDISNIDRYVQELIK